MILDLGVGECGLLDHRPHHGLGAVIESAVHQEFADLAHDLRLGRRGHGRIGILPIALDAEPLELRTLHVDPIGRELAALLTELRDRHVVLVLLGVAILLLDLPFDRQAVAVPARHIDRVLAELLLHAVDHVLQDLVEGVADVEVAVGVGRPVMEDEFLAALRLRARWRW